MPRKRRADPEGTRAALYRRVSSDGQTYGQSLEVQRKQGLALARARGWELVGHYVDAGVSGTMPGKQRPGLKQLLRDVRKGLIDQVIVAAVDRLGRRTVIVLEILDTLTTYGVVLTSYREGVDTGTPQGVCLITQSAAQAELEWAIGLLRTAEGRAERGRTDGEQGGNLPLGYRRKAGRIVIDARGAATVQRIFALKAARRNMSEIAEILNREGVPTSKGGTKWYPSSVREVLLRKAIYAGGRRGASEMCWPVILKPPSARRKTTD